MQSNLDQIKSPGLLQIGTNRDSEDMQVDLIIHSIGELVTAPVSDQALRGDQLNAVERIKNAAVAIAGERIVAIGTEEEILKSVSTTSDANMIDAGHKLVTAGLVDPHTHLVFAGNRANEFIMRCAGKSYAEIAQAGGGIVASVEPTRRATKEDLIALGKERLQRMLANGTTTCEVKTGYGLDRESEMRMLEAIIALDDCQPVELVPTFMAAHAVPKGRTSEDYVAEIIEEMLPAVAKINIEWCASGTRSGSPKSKAPICLDVFCDEGYFTLAESTRILTAGLALGLTPRIHADEFVSLGATKLAADLKAASADHLLKINETDIAHLAKSNTAAVLLPGTSFYLNLKEHAPARRLIESGVIVALGSDFNPGSCHIYSLPFIMGLACLHLKMTPAEALNATTINAAHALGLGHMIGQIREGYQADITIYDVPCLEEIAYNIGSNVVRQTIKKGRLVYGGTNIRTKQQK